MAYRFERDFASVQDGVRKVAVEMIDEAIACADSSRKDVHETVHSLRKACKKRRGLIRLVRPVFDAYPDENAAFRNAGQALSFLRDCGVLIETYDNLLECYTGQLDRSKFAPVRRRLTEMQKELAAHHDIPVLLEQFGRSMTEARKRARCWRINGDGFDALGRGIEKSYKQAQRAMSAASKDPAPENFHEWRKRVKDHWYHTRLVCPIWPKLMKTHCEVADRLGDALGRHHDLEIFQQRLARDHLGHRAERVVLAGLARARQATLEDQAFSIGARLLAEPARALTRRWELYWDAWHTHQSRGSALAA